VKRRDRGNDAPDGLICLDGGSDFVARKTGGRRNNIVVAVYHEAIAVESVKK